MALDWHEYTVSKLQEDGHLRVEDGNHGEYRPRSNEFVPNGVAFIRAADIEDGRVLFERASRINEVALSRIRKGVGAGGDVILSHKGTVGKLARVPLDAEPFVCSPQTTFWRSLNEEVIDRRFLYFYMQSSGFHRQLDSRKGETDMAPYVSLTAQRQLQVVLPSIEQQRAIARILGTLDDKIELNRRMNRTLEAMAQKLFKSWFVDFDPVVTRSEGRNPFGMSADTAELFPRKFDGSDQGPIPAAWKVGTVDDATSLIIDYRGKTPKKLGSDWSDSGVPAISAKNIKNGRLVQEQAMKYVDEELYERWMKDKLKVGDILMTSEAPFGELLHLTRIATYCLSQRVFGLRANPERCTSAYLYFWLRQDDAQEELDARSTGTTVLGIRQSELRLVRVLLPPLEVQRAASRFLDSCLTQISVNDEQSKAMRQVRDTLLPRLLSGELRVTNACEAAEEVVT